MTSLKQDQDYIMNNYRGRYLGKKGFQYIAESSVWKDLKTGSLYLMEEMDNDFLLNVFVELEDYNNDVIKRAFKKSVVEELFGRGWRVSKDSSEGTSLVRCKRDRRFILSKLSDMDFLISGLDNTRKWARHTLSKEGSRVDHEKAMRQLKLQLDDLQSHIDDVRIRFDKKQKTKMKRPKISEAVEKEGEGNELEKEKKLRQTAIHFLR